MLEKVWALVLALEQIDVVKLHFCANLFRYDEYAVRACREWVTIELVNHVKRSLKKGRKVDESAGKHIYVESSMSQLVTGDLTQARRSFYCQGSVSNLSQQASARMRR